MARRSKQTADTSSAAPQSAAAAGPLDPPLDTIEYIGPAGQESPVLGPLSVGSRYQVNVTFAAYLLERHPDIWTRPSARA